MISLQLQRIFESHCSHLAASSGRNESQRQLSDLLAYLESGLYSKEGIRYRIIGLCPEDQSYIYLAVRRSSFSRHIITDDEILTQIIERPVCLLRIYCNGGNFIRSRINAPFQDAAIKQMKWEVSHLNSGDEKMEFENVYLPILKSLRLIEGSSVDINSQLVTLIDKIFTDDKFSKHTSLLVYEPKVQLKDIIETFYAEDEETRWELAQSFLQLGYYTFVIDNIPYFNINDEERRLILMRTLIDRGEGIYVAQLFKDFRITNEINRAEAIRYITTKHDEFDEILEYFSEFEITEVTFNSVIDLLIEKGCADDIAVNFEQFGITTEKGRIAFGEKLIIKERFEELITTFNYFEINSTRIRNLFFLRLYTIAESKRESGDLSLWKLIIENYQNFELPNQERAQSIILKCIKDNICLDELVENFEQFQIEDAAFKLMIFSQLLEPGKLTSYAILAEFMEAFDITSDEEKLRYLHFFIQRRDPKVIEAVILNFVHYEILEEHFRLNILDYIIENSTKNLLKLLAQNFHWFSITDDRIQYEKFQFFLAQDVFETIDELEDGFKKFNVKDQLIQISIIGEFFVRHQPS